MVCWVTLAVWSNIIGLIANEAMPGLGLAGSLCRPKIRLMGKKALNYCIYFLC